MANTSGIMGLYTAYFNRAADKAGVDYWGGMMDSNGWSLDNVAQSFSDQVEYQNQYNGLTQTQIVEQVYQNVLNRAGEVDGVNYWSGELSSGNISVSQLVQAIVNAAVEKDGNGNYKNSTDATIFNNKFQVSQYCYDNNVNAIENNAISLSSISTDPSSISSLQSIASGFISKEESITTFDLTSDIGDSINNHGLLSVGSSAIGTVSYSPYDGDWYKIDLRQGNKYAINVSAELNNSEIYANIYDLNGNMFFSNILDMESDDNGKITTYLSPEEDSSYFVAVNNYWFKDTYTLSLSEGTKTVVDIIGDTLDNHGYITLDSIVNGLTDYQGDDDWYSIQLEASHVYDISLDIENNSGNELVVFNSNGEYYAWAYSPIHVDKSGTYYINASQLWAGEYSLEITDLGKEIQSKGINPTLPLEEVKSELPNFVNNSNYSIAYYEKSTYENAYMIDLAENTQYTFTITSDNISVEIFYLTSSNFYEGIPSSYSDYSILSYVDSYALSDGQHYTYVYKFKTGDGKLSYKDGNNNYIDIDLNINNFDFAVNFYILKEDHVSSYKNYYIGGGAVERGLDISHEDYIPMNTYQGTFDVTLETTLI